MYSAGAVATDEGKEEMKMTVSTNKISFFEEKFTPFLPLNIQLFAEGEEEGGEHEQQEEHEEETITLTKEEWEKQKQQEADKRVTSALKKQEEKMKQQWEKRLEEERKEAEELAKLSEAERAKVESEKQKMKFEEERRTFEKQRVEFEREKLFLETEKVLSSEKLPTEFAGFVIGENAEKTHENIQAFKEKFQEAVQAQVNDVLKGKAPRTGGTKLSELDQLEKERQEAIKNRDMAKAISLKNKIFELQKQEE